MQPSRTPKPLVGGSIPSGPATRRIALAMEETSTDLTRLLSMSSLAVTFSHDSHLRLRSSKWQDTLQRAAAPVVLLLATTAVGDCSST